MQAEIVAIGTELMTGANLDTNSQWLSRELVAVGIPVQLQTTVGDHLDEIVTVLQTAVARSDVVLVTGGLGPTLDDLTRQALAELTQTELVLHQPSLEFIQALFARRKQTMPERNRVQAMIPAGSRPIPNPRGTAPGIWVEVSRPGTETPCKIAAMPGVPSEMKRMFQKEVLPLLSGNGRVIRQAKINCFGIGESSAEELLGELTARGRDPEVGITAHEATITLRITAQGESVEQCEEKLAATRTVIYEKMGDLVFGENDEELQDVVVRLLKQRNFTLATAESGTGGLIAHRLTGVEGFEACYLGGVIAPTDAAKRDLLDVSERLLETHSLISAEIAAEMALGCRERFQTDFALAVTECPAFDPEEATSEAPSVFLALSGHELLEVRELNLLGDPAIMKSRTAKAAFNLLRLRLLHSEQRRS